MANLLRSAKCGSSDWTLNDPDSYHISLNQMDPLPFFGLQVGEDSFAIALGKTPTTFHVTEVARTLLRNADAGAMQQDRHAQLITYFDLAVIPGTGETAVVDFTVEFFKVSELCSSRTSCTHAGGPPVLDLRRE